MTDSQLREVGRQDLRAARAASLPPLDFEAFWQRASQQLVEQEPAPHATETLLPPAVAYGRQPATPAVMQSLAGAPVRCWFSRNPRSESIVPPAADGQPSAESSRSTSPKQSGRPLLVTCHGYGGQVDRQRVRRLGTFGFDVVAFDARGFGESHDAVKQLSPHGYLLTGCEAPDTSILKGAVCDYLQAARAGIAWYGKPTRLVFQGFSFAGGLAVMAAGVACMQPTRGQLPKPDILAVGAPTFGNNQARVRLCETGSGRELADYLRHFPQQRGRTLETLNYFDSVHFAPYVQSRVIAGVGLFDPVVPAWTVYSIINAFSVTPEIFEMPCSHTTRPEEQQWIRWESAWIRATQGHAPKKRQRSSSQVSES